MKDAITEEDTTIFPPNSMPGFVVLTLGGAKIFLTEPDVHIGQLIAVLSKAREQWNEAVYKVAAERV